MDEFGASLTALKSAFADELSSCATPPPPISATPTPPDTHAAVVCQGCDDSTGAVLRISSFGGVTVAPPPALSSATNGSGFGGTTTVGCVGVGSATTTATSFTTTRSFCPAIGDTDRV